MQAKLETSGPVALTSVITTNLLTPAAAGAGAVNYTATASFLLVSKIRIISKSASVATVSIFKGATGANAAGTELMNLYPVPAQSIVEFNSRLRLEGANGFLVGGCPTGNALLTVEFEFEIGLV